MLIGVDASRASHPRPTGTENYSYQLIRELTAIDTGNRYQLYFNRRPMEELLTPRNGRVEARVIPFPRLWTHVRLSWEMVQHPPDVLFVPAHVLPIVHPPASVVTIHDLGYLFYPQAHRALHRLYLDLTTRFHARAATYLIADSRSTKDDLMSQYGVDSERVAVAHPGLDGRFQPVRDKERLMTIEERYGLDERYIFSLGTLQPRKNFVRLIHAFARLPDDYKLVIAGKRGWRWKPIVRAAKEAKGRVHLLGYVAREDLPALLSGAEVFVLPSLYEGFGFPVLEAMACGTPVICSNTSSLLEVAADAAKLVDPLDVTGLADAMQELLEDPSQQANLQKRGFRQVKQFTWKRCAQEILSVLNKAAQRS